MKSFKNYLSEIYLIELEELEELNEAKKVDDRTKVGSVSNNTSGVLHELLVGRHLQGGKHMAAHTLVNEKTKKRETPQEAHDRLKSQIHPKDYERINARAKSAADDIKKQVATSHPGHVIDHVHHTSKPGDTEKETGVKATQKDDTSDLYITSKHTKTGKLAKHGVSLKVSDKSSKNIPSSSLGMESSGKKARELYKQHQEDIKTKHPALKSITNSEDRKAWAEKNPTRHNAIKKENRKLLGNVAQQHAAELQHHLTMGNHEHVVNHLRGVLGANLTPAEKEGKATFKKHTTYLTSKGTQHHTSHPGSEHDHILNDHENISVTHTGGSVHFHHTDPKTGIKKKFATQAHKFDSQSDPLSPLKSAGKAT